ncbi:GntR family transcriptional regulator [Planktotalea frisia]|uniref:Mannosyl-D-glycerate transport/metabolism system repressor MngR n=1 Tax=Planktotalea frisia TaxID=696762 RepID=A0A1L9P2E6_9RHOB|nr:GntR family transcriptional regulator [Planktotalea frisia]OJI95584.1 mannosyl-D-glycerate transport/metabolism system repressor MngR [Planktotalea frisia]PZX20556.1 GntR family transcriptional regulator [Planktotalea frisia]
MPTQNALPLYVQIAELLIRDIAAGRYLDGERLPPERDLALSLSTTVTTLRKALVMLEQKELLKRVQGSGNYVQVQSDVESVYAFFRVELLQGGGLPTARLLSMDRCEKPNDLPEFGSSTFGYRIRRLRSLSAVPCVLEEIWLDGSYAASLSADMLSDSLYLFYREVLGLWITRAEDRLSVAPCPDWAPQEFAPAKGSSLAYAERISWAQDGARAEVSRNWIDTSKAHYVARIK